MADFGCPVLGSLVFLFSKTLELFSFPIFRLGAYLMTVITDVYFYRIYPARKMSDHVFVCWGYLFCVVLLIYSVTNRSSTVPLSFMWYLIKPSVQILYHKFLKYYKNEIRFNTNMQPSSTKKSKALLAQNQNNVSEWSDMYTRGLICMFSVSQQYNNSTQCVGLEQIGPHHHLIEN